MNGSIRIALEFAEALASAGVEHVVISPGSRSTPLVFGFLAAPVQTHVVIDERAAAFLALGIANASGKPVVLVCTSGSAPAHYWPAVVEAHQSGIPLIILTADRPGNARDSGANQTVDQAHLYGRYARWFYELTAPVEARNADIRLARAIAHRAAFVALQPPAGVVHINLPFDKPLEPTEPGELQPPDERLRVPLTLRRSVAAPTSDDVMALLEPLLSAQRGVVLCGPRCPQGGFAGALLGLAERLGYPILADSLSGLRFLNHPSVLRSYETWLPLLDADKAPDVVLQFGAPFISQAAERLFDAMPPRSWVAVNDGGQWLDPLYATTHFLQADATAFCSAAAEKAADAKIQPDSGWTMWLQQLDDACSELAEDFCDRNWFDGAVAQTLLRKAPDGVPIYIANSLSIRHVDQFGLASRAGRLFANRGASGIDGTIASALGVAIGQGAQVVSALLGDLALLHDLNSLMLTRDQGVKLVAVVVNNDGGGIFARLPIARFEPPFRQFFLTPHGWQFEQAAAQFGLRYACVASRGALAEALEQAYERPGSMLIEAQTDAVTDEALRRQYLSHVHDRLQHTEISR